MVCELYLDKNILITLSSVLLLEFVHASTWNGAWCIVSAGLCPSLVREGPRGHGVCPVHTVSGPRTLPGTEHMVLSFWSPTDQRVSLDSFGKSFCCSEPPAPHL